MISKIKAIILCFMQTYWRHKFSKRAVIKGRVYFGRHSRIELSGGSCKEDVEIGDNVKLYGSIVSHGGGKVVVEDCVHLGPFSVIGAVKSVHVKKYAMISTGVHVIDNNNHPVHPDERRMINEAGPNTPLKGWQYSTSSPVVIGENVWLGRGTSVLKGVEVGDDSVVASSAVVTKDVPVGVIVAGNPARVVKTNIYNERKLFC